MAELSPRVAAELAKDVYLVQNEKLLGALLTRPEFSKDKSVKTHLVAEVGGHLLRTSKDGFGVCALGGKGYENELFLIFRGSTFANRNADWISNGRIGIQTSRNGLPVHIGFNSIFNSMRSDIERFLTRVGNIRTIHCIGHSLGGAVATLVADWIRTYLKQSVKLYTFGAPRPGLILFAHNLTRKLGSSNIYRAYHAADPVPMVPVFPYIHSPLPGFGYYIPWSESILSVEAHDIGKYVKSVSKSGWNQLERRVPEMTADHLIERWLQSTYPVNPASPKLWQWINVALVYVLKKVLGPAVQMLQASFMGALTLADKIAWALRRGIVDPYNKAKEWVVMLMRKIMQALGMKLMESSQELTQTLMRYVLMRLIDRINEQVRKALRNIR